MTEPVWLTEADVLAPHDSILGATPGSSGVRDMTLLGSALARPRSRFVFGAGDIPACAAAYAFGIAKNRPFVDGNKRTAILSMDAFLLVNGLPLAASDSELADWAERVAAGTAAEDDLAEWLRART